jgi:hypothetical protein
MLSSHHATERRKARPVVGRAQKINRTPFITYLQPEDHQRLQTTAPQVGLSMSEFARRAICAAIADPSLVAVE